MCHLGFQQLYEQESTEGLESPRQTVSRLVEQYKGTIEKVTVVGHSLGAGESWSGKSAHVPIWECITDSRTKNVSRASILSMSAYGLS